MDLTLRLRLELDRIQTEHLRRDAEASRRDLLDRLSAVREESRKARIPAFTIVALSRAAEIMLDSNQPSKAISFIKMAQGELGESDPQGRGVDLLAKHARACAALYKWEEASSFCGEGIQIIEQYRKKVTPLGLQSAYLRFKIELYQIGVRSAFELKDFELALERAELAKCATSRRMIRDAASTPRDLSNLQEQYRQICELLDSDSHTDEARARLVAKRRATWDIISIHRFRENDSSDYAFRVTELMQALNQDEVAVYYFWLSRLQLLVFAITADVLFAELKTLEDSERSLIEGISDAVLNFGLGNGKLIEPTEKHMGLLFPPSILGIISDKKRLIISPHRVLHLIPFHAVPIDDQFLIDRFAVSYVPNLNSILVRYSPTTEPRLFALGVPKTKAKVGYEISLSEIKNAEEEVSSISAHYSKKGHGTLCAVGPKATEALLRKMDETGELAKFSHLHFACHGESVDSDSPLESRLILHDTVLDGLDIAGFEFGADLVVLSACCSGQRPFQTPSVGDSRNREELPGDELFGLQAAFFAAGVRQMVSTMWPVDSKPALEISRDFHNFILAGETPDRALQQAIIDYKAKAGLFGGTVDMWAPFFLVSLSMPN